MLDLSIGAVGAAMIAAFISLASLILGKEQKTSEFRQQWINDLRSCMVKYLTEVNAVADARQLIAKGQSLDNDKRLSLYRCLNDASNGIKLRLNDSEPSAQKLLKVMTTLESLGSNGKDLTPAVVQSQEEDFLKASSVLLKLEWKRVKEGEIAFRATKYLLMVMFFGLTGYGVYLYSFSNATVEASTTPKEPSNAGLALEKPAHIPLTTPDTASPAAPSTAP